MKTVIAGVVLAVVLGGLTACQNSEPPGGPTSTTPSASPTVGEASREFEGDGDIDTVNTEEVELYGTYTVKWEISGNKRASDDDPALFTTRIEGGQTGDVRPATIVREEIVEGSGKQEITIHKAGKFRAAIEASPTAHWKLTFNRTWK